MSAKKRKHKKEGLIEHIDLTLSDFRTILALLEWVSDECGNWLPDELAEVIVKIGPKFGLCEAKVEEKIQRDPTLDPTPEEEAELAELVDEEMGDAIWTAPPDPDSVEMSEMKDADLIGVV